VARALLRVGSLLHHQPRQTARDVHVHVHAAAVNKSSERLRMVCPFDAGFVRLLLLEVRPYCSTKFSMLCTVCLYISYILFVLTSLGLVIVSQYRT
jgi:hypothetical protein